MSAPSVPHLIASALLVGLASWVGPTGALAQPGPVPEPAPAFDCQPFLESVRRLQSVSVAMLAQLQARRAQLENMRTALGTDLAEEMLALLAEQEKRLRAQLREAEAAHSATGRAN